ncbi:MAG: hypothetical protein FK733_12760 [Asgard group archaeon]|nr:hypothetical protein [Asgard group archaeon]
MNQNIITYKQRVAVVPDENALQKMYSDENLMLIIEALRKGPMTIDELVKEFEDKGQKKSDKSVYRYLKELIELKIVARAGKRIKSIDEKDLQSETIYIRTAKIFLTGNLKHKAEKLGKEKIDQLFDVLKSLLMERYSDKITSKKALHDLLIRFDEKKEKLLIELLENANKETLKKISVVDWGLIVDMVEYAGWLALLLEQDLEKELKKCRPE